MQRGQSSNIHIRKKPSFKPIMLTSKSMKPVERSFDKNNKNQPKVSNKIQNNQYRRTTAQHCMLYANTFAKAEFIRKMTQQYRDNLLKNMCSTEKSEKAVINCAKPLSASIVQVEFEPEENTNSSNKNYNSNRYDNAIMNLAIQNRKLSSKKYFYYTDAKVYDGSKPKQKIKNNNTQLLTSSHYRNQQKSEDYSPQAKNKFSVNSRAQQWHHFLKKNSLTIRKSIKSQNQSEINVSKQKLQEISMKVSEYQQGLLKRIQQNYNNKINNLEESQHGSQEQVNKMTTTMKNDSTNKSKILMKKTDLIRIQQDITTKRPSFNKKQYFVFGMGQSTKNSESNNSKLKMEIYKDFLWKIAYSNSIYIHLKDQIQHPYKVYIGPGNNSLLVKGILRRRFWWQIVDKITNQTNFIWTQLKNNEFYTYQKRYEQTNNKTQHKIPILRTRKVYSSMDSNEQMRINRKNNAEINKINKQQLQIQGEEQQQEQNNRNKSQLQENNQLQYQSRQVQRNKIEHKSNQSYSYKILSEQMDPNLKIFMGNDYQLWQRNYLINKKYQQKMENTMLNKRIKTLIRKKNLKFIEQSRNIKVQNHLECNYYLGNKKALFYSLKKYYTLLNRNPFEYIPLTFHIVNGLNDPQFHRFMEYYEELQEEKRNKKSHNIWIVKPGQHTNRGKGITVCSMLDQIKIRLKSKQKSLKNNSHTYILQKYIERPLLYCRRKFDIRHYMLMTCVNGQFKGYWYSEGYLRTTSFQYHIRNCKDLYTHLTNDAIQKASPDYGKYEKGNKVSYTQFQKYLRANYKTPSDQKIDKYDFFNEILPKMKQIATDAMKSTYMQLSPKRYEHNYELFGLDFMLDEDMNVYLIEVNTNPCLETLCPLLSKLISGLIQNVFKICVDPYFPPTYQWPNQRKMGMGDNALEENKFTLVFDQNCEGEKLMKLYEQSKNVEDNLGEIDEEEEVYEDQGKQWVQD